MWLCRVSKCIGRLVVRRKAIKYKKNFLCYLFSYLILQTLAFKPYAFKLLSSIKHICSSLGFQIRPNNLNYTPFAEFLTIYSMPKLSGNTRMTNFSCCYVTRIGVIYLPKSRTYCVKWVIHFTTYIMVS